jgi:hypothetical protein
MQSCCGAAEGSCGGVCGAVHMMVFDAETSEMVRKAVAEGRYDLLYVMVPAMDGGQTYEMKCKICGEFGNILANTFIHAQGCPVDIEEKRSYGREQR